MRCTIWIRAVRNKAKIEQETNNLLKIKRQVMNLKNIKRKFAVFPIKAMPSVELDRLAGPYSI